MLGARLGFDWWPPFPTAGEGVTVGLTGLLATAAAGVLAVSLDVGLAGLQATADAGVLSVSTDVGLAGAQAESSAGDVGYSVEDANITVALVGSDASAASGAFGFAFGGGLLNEVLGDVTLSAFAGVISNEESKEFLPAGAVATFSQDTIGISKDFGIQGISVAAMSGTIIADLVSLGWPMWIDETRVISGWIDGVEIASIHLDSSQLWP